jgi:hypothetical protein
MSAEFLSSDVIISIALPLNHLYYLHHWDAPNEYQLTKQKKVARRCGKEYPEGYKYFSRPLPFAPEQTELDAVNFIESLDMNKVQQVSNLPLSHLKDIFLAVAESELPKVRYRDFDEQGMVLLTGAYMSIWRAYLYLVELSSDYLE